MESKILVAMDDSENALRAVTKAAKFFNPNAKVTLFSVLPDTAALCDMNSPELTSYFMAQKASFCALEDKKKELIQSALQKAKNMLVEAGFDAGNITLKMETKKHGIARDILAEAANGYDTVVMGRRGLSGIKEFILGSVSQKVLHSAVNISIMMVN